MITQRFGFTKGFTKKWNNRVYFRLSKILCGFKDQVRARPSGEKCGLAIVLVLFIVLVAVDLLISRNAHAEYGDVVINNYSDEAEMRPVVFPHWFHRVRFRCKVCHADLGFKFEAGGNDINMLKIIDGEYCGACHDGDIAWSVENCDLCHSGTPGTPTQVHESTLQKLVTPSTGTKAK